MTKNIKSLALCLAFFAAAALSACQRNPSVSSESNEGTLAERAEGLENGFLNTTATDDFGRSFDTVSEYEKDKYVGIFYFLWNGSNQSPIKDVTNNYEKNDTLMSELLARAADGGTPEVNSFHYWGEPLYGYYNADDEWVLRKHIELFIHAGLDFIAFDTTNARIYDSQVYTFLDLLLEYKQQGFEVPKVMFMTSVDVGDSKTTVQLIYDAFYDPSMHEEYEELWFRGNRNKPWIIGSKTGDSVTDSYFYFKLPQWPNAAIQSSKFPWIDWNYPQDIYKDAQLGNVMSVSVSQHVGLMGKSNGTYADFSDSGLFAPENRAELTGKGFSFSEEYIEKVYNANWGRGYDHATKQNSRARALEGTNFEQQWKTVLDREKDGEASNDIGLVFVTGWNEWIAQKQANSRILGDKYCHFVDTFNMEFSRDIEMNAEYLDNYYLSLVRNIRAYKGVASAAAYSESEDCSGLMNNLDGWNSASAAVYRDFSGETIARNAVDTSGQSELVNVTGRNDIREIRVMSDAEKIYMLVRTEENITPHAAGDTHWMNVFLGIGGQTGGWQGLQYVFNKNPGKEKTSLHRMTNNSFDKIGECNYTVKGNVLRIEIDKKLLGISVADYTLKFKIADNLQKDFDVADLYVSGDTAPLGRMSYVYRAAAK